MFLWESQRSIQYICTLLISPQTTCHMHCLPRAVYKHPQVCTTIQQTASRQAGDIGPALGQWLVFAVLSCEQTHLVTRRTRYACSVANTIRFISNFHKYMCTPISASSGMFWFSSAPRRVASRTPVRTCVHIVRESKKKNMTHQKKKQQVSSLA